RRLYLLKVLMEAPNVLVLDEPTNDLDIQTLTILEDYLETYPGIVVTVSHDRYFLDKIASRIFSFEEGMIRQYEGNFSDYKEAREQRGGFVGTSSIGRTVDNVTEEQKAASIATWKQKSNKPKFTYQEQKEYDTIDEQIAKLEEQIEETDQLIVEAATNYSKLNELMALKEKLEKSLEEKMDRWVYLNDLAEQIEAARSEK
ncbi:MAG: ATPase component of transporter with duplicated ATPase domain, partial [Herbinix sp.]|nr:ATPase component of transporter with duplicated ATPase domain [Herbinix sp.]